MKGLLTLQPHHVSGLLELWSHRWGAWFPLDRALWQQNTVGDPRHFHAERCWVVEEQGTVAGCLALKVPDDPPDWTGQDPRQAWISFLVVEPGREPALSPPLIERALKWLRGRGFERVSYGGDPSHFFPGGPEDDAALGRALEEAGFRPGERMHDLIAEMRHSRPPVDVDHPLRTAAATAGPCDPADVPALLRFLDGCFPGRWAYETRQRLAVEPTPADVVVLKRDKEVLGFCHVYHRGSRRVGPSIAWRPAIGDHYGGLGPIGVAPAFRGRGLGLALLALSVERLRGLGVERVVIDWTTLLDFYSALGFRVWRTYRAWRLSL